MKNKINDELNKVKKDLYLKAAAQYFDRSYKILRFPTPTPVRNFEYL
ncbi:MAG: hypothetical protein U5K55_01640 [Aliarcobacter sp.]|nr:hypothetical protein [Aliarcobacter sp.]